MAQSKANPQTALRPQDVVVLLRLALMGDAVPTYAALAKELGLTASEVHGAVDRAVAAQLAIKDAGKPSVILAALLQFVLHGARYCFAPVRGTVTRGMPTGYAAAPLKTHIQQGSDLVPVWPSKDGTVRGVALYPLYPSVPKAALNNTALYELLALFDAVRAGSARERSLAIEMLTERLKP